MAPGETVAGGDVIFVLGRQPAAPGCPDGVAGWPYRVAVPGTVVVEPGLGGTPKPVVFVLVVDGVALGVVLGVVPGALVPAGVAAPVEDVDEGDAPG